MRNIHPTSLVRQGPVEGMSQAVLLALAAFCDMDGQCWPSGATLVAASGLKRRTVYKALEELEKNGWIWREKRYKKSTIFTLNMDKLMGKPERENKNGFDPFEGVF